MNDSLPLSYDFAIPQRIVFGWGRRREVGSLARSLGRRLSSSAERRPWWKMG